MDIIKSADWIIDLGPQGDIRGRWDVIFLGAPIGLTKFKEFLN